MFVSLALQLTLGSSNDGGASRLLSLNYCSLDYRCLCKTICCIACTTSHTGEYMAKKYLDMLSEWKINHDKVHLVLHDNAANMAKAMREDFLPFLDCFANTLQLIVNDGGTFPKSCYSYLGCV